MSNSSITKLNNALYYNKLSAVNNPVKSIKDINGLQVIELNSLNCLTGKLTMFFNSIFGANGYQLVF